MESEKGMSAVVCAEFKPLELKAMADPLRSKTKPVCLDQAQ